MSNVDLFAKAVVAGAGFMAGAVAVLGVGLILAIIIGCIIAEEKN